MKKKRLLAMLNTLVLLVVLAVGLSSCQRGGEEPTLSTEAASDPTTDATICTTEPITQPEETTALTEEPTEEPTTAPTEPEKTDKPTQTEHKHDYKSKVTAPTCENKGYTTYTCSCGDTYKDSETPATGHDYKHTVIAPTCTAKGYTTYTCKNCGDTYRSNEVKATGHKYTSKVTAPTCEAKGYTTYTCKNCGDSYKDNEVKANGHKYETKTVAPTTTAQGYDLHTCKTCGKSYKDNYTEKLPAEPEHTHKYTETVTKPTCEAKGYTTYKCGCGHSYTGNEKPATGHAYKDTVTAPTCENKGYTTHTCGNCGKSYKDNETAAKGHSWGNWVQTKAPTVEAEGQEQRACGTCSKTETRAVAKLPDDGGDEGCTKHEYTWVCDPSWEFDTGTCKNCGETKVIYASSSETSQAVVNEINAYRTAAGLNELQWKGNATKLCMRATEITIQTNHRRLDGSGHGKAECIEVGAGNAATAVSDWYNSSSHNGIIMRADAKYAMAAHNGSYWVVWIMG